jgi:regulator of RNase E activity RraA
VFGDVDGVVVIPQTHELEVIDKAIAGDGENAPRRALRKGESLADVFKRFGIL